MRERDPRFRAATSRALRGGALGPMALAAALVLVAAPAQAGGPKGHHGRHGPPPLDRMIEDYGERLGLDPKVEAQIREIAEASHARQEELHGKLRELHGEMRDLLEQDSPEEAAVMEQARALGRVETEAHEEHLRAMLQIRKLLTPEQRAELVRIRKEEHESRWAALAGACGAELEEHCAGLEPGWQAKHCLREHRDELSEACREAAGGRGHGKKTSGDD